jgi:dCMP deaminase
MYMAMANLAADCSTAVRLRVGSVVVKDHRVLSIGYNGMPAGWDNDCEFQEFFPDGSDKMVTKPEVLHAEENAIVKMARDGQASKGATMYCTHAPCMQCAKLIYGSGIQTLIYESEYRDTNGTSFLEASGVKVVHRKPTGN